MKRKKRMLAWLLALALTIQGMPAIAADNVVPSDGTSNQAVEVEQPETEKSQEGIGEIPGGMLQLDQLSGSVSGIVFSDQNADGKCDEDEKVVKGVQVKLYNAANYAQGNNAALVETVTDEQGTYQFTDLACGKYRLEVYAPDQAEEGTTLEGMIPEGMEEKIQSGEVDYEIVLPEEQDKWIVCIPEVEIVGARDLDVGLVENSSAASEEEPSENVSGADAEVEGKDSETEEEIKNNEAASDSEASVEGENVEGEASQSQEQNLVEKFDENVNLEQDMVVAETTVSNALVTAVRGFFGANWKFDAYYVNASDEKDIRLTENGNLKYQMEFKAREDFPTGSVVIRVPEMLLEQRSGAPLCPSEIAVPAGTVENPVESKAGPFNYYKDGTDLVFFNYEKIESGSNVAFQILYRNINMMQIKDGTTWELKPSCTVTVGDDSKTETSDPLTGKVDTTAKLNSISMKPYSQEGKSYSPGLYTEKQIAAIIGKVPEEYITNFAKYRYVAWDVTVHGEATQPWELYLKNSALAGDDGQGEVVGFSVPAKKGGSEYEDYYQIQLDVKNPQDFHENFQVVIAYPIDKATAGTEVTNHIEAILKPIDGIDESIQKETESSWHYADYKWTYVGNDVDVRKKGGGTYASWLNAYKAASKEGQDKGGFTFNIDSYVRGYEQTHITSGDDLGQLIDGSSYKMVTVDDFVYAYPNTKGISQAEYKILTGEDYYFDSVTVTQRDQGYDPWEDETASPETPSCEENGLAIYAMFAESDQPNEWTQVAVVPWEDGGTMNYSFTAEDIAKKPWRVKAEHRTTNYSTTCSIQVSMMIRHDSEYFSAFVQDEAQENEGNKEFLTVENLAGVMAELYREGESQGFMKLEGMQEGYKEPELKEKTEALYGTLPMRRNAFVYLSSLQEHAGAKKSGTSWNDVVNGRIHLQYNMTAFDGYDVYGEEAISYLKSEGVQSPGRNEVVFYDLLPYGVKFDPSVKVTAGRITNFDKNHNYQHYPASWDKSQITVTVDSEKDIIQDYKNTGRTMVIFHITYSGADAAVYSNQRWMEGFGVSFGAYYDWKDTQLSGNAANIVAFMSGDNTPLLGTANEVAKDDGTYPEALGNKDEYKILGSDIDGDGSTEDSVLYAQTHVTDDSAQASVSGIKKLVRADADRFGSYEETAEVDPGKGYTYDITVSNVSGTKTDMVVFDHLDMGAEDLANTGGVFDENRWKGSFAGVVTTGLTQAGVAPTIYYNEDPQAKTASDSETPLLVLTEENGWYTSEKWEASGKTNADVQSVAVDMSRGVTGDAFKLEDTSSVTFQIKMTSPSEVSEGKAYNAAQVYSVDDGAGASYTVSDAAEVSLDLEKQFELVKEFAGEIPAVVRDNAFVFTLYKTDNHGKRSKFSNQEYQLFEKSDEGTWGRVGEDQVYATDASGQVKLKADQKIVFSTPYASDLSASEEENPFWEQTVKMTYPEEDVTVQTVTNRYRPVLYAQKKLTSVPEGTDASGEAFTFRLVSDGEPVAEKEFWYVDSVRTDGGIPSKNTELGKGGVGKTDKNGEFKIRSGEIIALFPGSTDCTYELTEAEGSGEGTDWICEKPSVSGTLPYNGTSEEIENIYRWKDLYLTKELTNQDPAECTQEFTFSITDEDGQPLSGKNWVLMEAGADTDVAGTTDKNGRLTAACAGKTIRVEDLEGGKSYTIKEIDDKGFEDGDYYEPVNQKEEVTMPVYGALAKITFTNDYILRDLTISKVVNYDPKNLTEEALESIREREFTMTVEVDGKLLKNKPYSIVENEAVVGEAKTDDEGKIKIKNGQTALFAKLAPEGITYKVTETQDEEYPQIFPVNKKPAEGTFKNDGASVQFINGTDNTFIIGKEYVAADPKDSIEKEYIQKVRNDLRASSSVELELQIADVAGEFHAWPEQDTEVLVIDTLTSQVENITWNAGSSLMIEPWKNVCISSLEGSTAYRLSEKAEYQHKVFRYTGDDQKEYTLEISQKTPENDGAVEGILQEQPKAVIVNGIRNLDVQNDVVKRMLAGDGSVPEGAQLAYRVEAYDGQVWNPAENIEYIVTDAAGIVSEHTETTRADGMILMHKTVNGTPTVEFIDRQVKVHPKDPIIGTLRVVEVAEHTDDAWGRFAGYVDDRGQTGVNIWDGIGFANSNTAHEFEVAKIMEEATDATFTMLLEQIVSSTASPVTDKSQIVEKIPGKGIRYEVYDSESGEYIGENITGNKGEIYLKAGQHAKLMIEDGTEWTVTEKIPNGYTLKGSAISGGDKPVTAVKLEENLTVITSEKPREDLPGITLTKEMVETGVVDADTGEVVQLKEGKVAIPEKIIVDSKRYYVTAIGESAFAGSVSIEEGEDGMPYPVFASKLIEVVLPDTVTEVQDKAFSYCGNIKKLVLPDSLRKVGEQAFGAVGLAYQNTGIDEEHEIYICGPLKDGAETFEVPEGITEIGEMAFAQSNVGKAEIPECVTLGRGVFAGCVYLEKCVLSGELKEIPYAMFQQCYNPSFDVKIPEGVEKIGDFAFYYAAFDVELPDSVTTIGENAFFAYMGERYDKVLRLPENLESIGENAFAHNTIKEIEWNAKLKSIGRFCFADNRFTEITLPAGVEIQHGAFYYNDYLETAIFAEGTKIITEWMFYECPNLKTVIMPEGVTEIGESVFRDCPSLESIDIPTTVETIGTEAFDGCSSLKEIVIPASVQYMGTDPSYNKQTVFNGCEKLEKIIIQGEKRPLNKKGTNVSNLSTKWGAPDSTEIIWEIDQK